MVRDNHATKQQFGKLDVEVCEKNMSVKMNDMKSETEIMPGVEERRQEVDDRVGVGKVSAQVT